MAFPAVFGPDERLDLADGGVVQRGGVLRRFTRRDYYRLAELGILAPDERTELIHGLIIRRVSPPGRSHDIAVGKTAAALRAAFGGGHAVEQQMPTQMGDDLEPSADVAVLRGASDEYPDVPLASDVLLLLEVSGATLRYDRGTKAALYAAGGVPEYWLLNLWARTLEVRRQPEGGEYVSLDVYGEGEAVAPLAAPASPVRVADLIAARAARKEPLSLDDLLEQVNSKDTFLRFARALAADFEDEREKEEARPTPWLGLVPGANGWYNFTIDTFLDQMCLWAAATSAMTDEPMVPEQPSWRAFAEMLYMGKKHE